MIETVDQTAWGVFAKRIRAGWSRDRSSNKGFQLTAEDIEIVTSKTCRIPITGVTGAGKSTFLYLLATLKWPRAGEICWRFPDGKRFIWGKKGKGLSAEELYVLRGQYFGFAFQNSTLLPHLTVRENLSYPLWQRGLSTRLARKITDEKLGKVRVESDPKLAEFLGRFPSQLSGGQRQRAALAQAWIHDPYVLFADEPTGNLDSQTRREVMKVIDNWLNEQPGKRLFIWVTHHDEDKIRHGVAAHIEVRNGAVEWKSA
uniref:Putative ABC transport system ATP-binding protein n=1 Tax=Candidatus Kentrum sp. MB TaxID=2138164 RepID=A0A450XMD1_9GAMM|nr:MAG: putative ABC transport system ATP-binding protein [Candidatus Kentron sp. MB]